MQRDMTMKEYNLTIDEAVAFINHRQPQYIKKAIITESGHIFLEDRERTFFVDTIDLKTMVSNGKLPYEQRGKDYYFCVEDLKAIQEQNDQRIYNRNKKLIKRIWIITAVICFVLLICLVYILLTRTT